MNEYSRIKEKFKDDRSIKYKILKFLRLDKTKKIFEFKTGNPNKFDQKVFQDFKKIMELTKKLSKDNSANFYFVYIPEYLRLKKKEYNNENYFKIINIINDLDISLIDLNKELFDVEKNPLSLYPFNSNGHFNIEGYKKVSELIYNRVDKEK